LFPFTPDEFALVMTELRNTGKQQQTIDRILMDLHFDSLDKDNSGDIVLEEFIAGYSSLFHEERRELALMLHQHHPGASFPLFLVQWPTYLLDGYAIIIC